MISAHTKLQKKTEQLAFLWILLILIVVGNMAVLLALGMSGARKSRMNYFIKHLAIAGKLRQQKKFLVGSKI